MPDELPKSTRRRNQSSLKSGRTIGGHRERLETSSERIAIHKKIKRSKRYRLLLTLGVFVILAAILFGLGLVFFGRRQAEDLTSIYVEVPYSPTIEIIDEDANATGGIVTSRMKEYVGQIETDLREFGYIPTKAVIPTGAIREVDLYLENFTGYLKFTIDRGSGVSAEDSDRMIRYLKSQDVSDFRYIDLRVDGKSYWRPLD